LEVAEAPAPPPAGAHGLHLAADEQRETWRTLQLVDHGEFAHAGAALGDLVREAREALRLGLGVHQHPPGLDELARWIRFQDLAVHDDVGNGATPHLGAGPLHVVGRDRAIGATRTYV